MSCLEGMGIAVFGEVGDLNLAAAAAADNEVVNGLSWGGTGRERRRIIWTWA